jgi:hypothetical protein
VTSLVESEEWDYLFHHNTIDLITNPTREMLQKFFSDYVTPQNQWPFIYADLYTQ